MPSDGPGERNVVLAIVVVAVITLVYSVVIAGQILAWFGIAIPLVLLYLVWRFVRAHERIADALEE
jgi:Flp pilus assembly protein TadB